MPFVAESHVFWYGDNLQVMREHIGDETIDLIYLDPPFNSQRIYNRFFGEADGTPSDAQRRAFEDYWRWGPEAAKAFDEVVHPRTRRHVVPASLTQTMEMFKGILHESNMLAYLSMMAVRLVEMRRVLKRTGSLYLHCDPTACHYLKLILDALFGPGSFRNEIVWKRTSGHSDAVGYGSVHDTLLFYTHSDVSTWNPQHVEYDEEYAEKYYRYREKPTAEHPDGRRFMSDNLSAAGLSGGGYTYTWKGIKREWRCPPETMADLDRRGLVFYTKNGIPRRKRYLDEAKGLPAPDVWTDVEPLRSWHEEKTGYPTQKPVALLKRIIQASSKEGDLVLDPFCGCGTAVIAAQTLGRHWIGIDVTHIAVSVLKQRMEKAFPGLAYRVRGEPEDVASARRLADEKWEEFQAWIVDKVGGMPLNPAEEKGIAKKGKDHGIDGLLLFRDDPKAARSKRMILSVKAGKTITPDMVDSLAGVVARENATAGVLLTAHKPTPGVLNTARANGFYSSDVYTPNEKFQKIQVVSVEDIFSPGWRGIRFPGANTSRISQPPPGTPGASEELFKPRPPRKTAPPSQQELVRSKKK